MLQYKKMSSTKAIKPIFAGGKPVFVDDQYLDLAEPDFDLSRSRNHAHLSQLRAMGGWDHADH